MTQLTQTRHYKYDPIFQRKKLTLPEGKKIVVMPFVNIEHFPEDVPGTPVIPATTQFTPDVLNYGWRDYGSRVGVWRLMEILDELNIRPTVCLNSDVIDEYPLIIEEGMKRKWCWMGHGKNNAPSSFLNGNDEAAETALISDTLKKIEAVTGEKVKGWLSPFLTETYSTPVILERLGVEYLCDFTCDDQPFKFNTPENNLVSIPYSLEINDIPAAFNVGITGKEFADIMIDQFDVLYQESDKIARMMPVCIHPFVTGQPFRAGHFRRALQYIASKEGVWFATSDEINDWYRKDIISQA